MSEQERLAQFDKQFERNKMQKRILIKQSCDKMFAILSKLEMRLDPILDSEERDAAYEVEGMVEFLLGYAENNRF
jgi:hypothetical protein